MSITGYLADHWGLLILLIGMGIALFSDIHLERRMIHRIAVTNIMLFMYSISCYVESYLGFQTEYTVLRPVLSALNYSLITFMLVNIIMIVYPGQKVYLFFPAVLNCALCFISLKTGLVFYIDENNHFHRGTLGYLTYFIDALYLMYLILDLSANPRTPYDKIFYHAAALSSSPCDSTLSSSALHHGKIFCHTTHDG